VSLQTREPRHPFPTRSMSPVPKLPVPSHLVGHCRCRCDRTEDVLIDEELKNTNLRPVGSPDAGFAARSDPLRCPHRRAALNTERTRPIPKTETVRRVTSLIGHLRKCAERSPTTRDSNVSPRRKRDLSCGYDQLLRPLDREVKELSCYAEILTVASNAGMR